MKKELKRQWGFARSKLYKNNLIFVCSRKADVELIYRTSLWELF